MGSCPDTVRFSEAEIRGKTKFQVLTAVVMKGSTSTDVSEEHVAVLATCFTRRFLAQLIFDPEDGGDMFLRNVAGILTDYTPLHPRRQNSPNFVT
jgi:hypothetical protein